MAIELENNPLITSLEQDMLGAFGLFPDQLYLIKVGEDKFACNNATMTDGAPVEGLACFPSSADADHYSSLLAGLGGDIVGKWFDEARSIAISKPRLQAMLLFVKGAIVEIHFVR